MSEDPRIEFAPVGASVLEHALALGRSGLRVLPVHGITEAGACTCGGAHEDGKSIGKHPVRASWQKSATHEEQAIRDLFRVSGFVPNLGLCMGHQPLGCYLAAVDVDDHARFDALVEKFGPLPDTLKSISGRGYRLIFRIEGAPLDRIKNVTALDGAPGVDVKVAGGQIVVAPSKHASGAVYQWGETQTIAELPPNWLAAILSKPEVPRWVHQYTPTTLNADRRALGRARKGIEKVILEEAGVLARTSQGGRNDALHKCVWRILPLIRGYMVSDMRDFMVRELSRAARATGLPASEVDRTIASAERGVEAEGAVRTFRDRPAPEPIVEMAREQVADVEAGEPVDEDEPAEAQAEESTSEGDSAEAQAGEFGNDGEVKPPPKSAQSPKLLIDRGQIAPIAANVARCLALYPRGAPRLNLFSRRVVWPDGKPVVDADAVAIQEWQYQQDESKRVRASIETIHAGIAHAAQANAYHPVRDYLNSLVWDGKERVSRLFPDYFGASDRPFERAASKCFLIGCVARVMEPGCKMDSMPVLEGKQGIGKSTALSILAGEWFSDSLIPQQEPNCYQVLGGVWIYEMSELAAMRGREVERIKAFMTSRVDRYRQSYGRTVEDVPRQTVFCGTTNASHYLADETGGRRYHPIRCDQVDLEALRRDRDQLWAEAAHLYREGEPWHLSGAVAVVQADVVEQRRHEDPWESIVDAVAHVDPSRLPVDVAARAEQLGELVPGTTAAVPTWTVSEWLFVIGIDAGKQTKQDEMRLSRILTQCGFKRARVVAGVGRKYAYRLEVGT